MSWTADRNGSASPVEARCRTANGRPDPLPPVTSLQGLVDFLGPALTVVRTDELEALHRDRTALAALRKEAIGLRLHVLFLQGNLERCRYELELSRGW